ncbi:MAG: hypothetical protein WKH64_13465 [Chloroflexia bacterium]
MRVGITARFRYEFDKPRLNGAVKKFNVMVAGDDVNVETGCGEPPESLEELRMPGGDNLKLSDGPFDISHGAINYTTNPNL